MKKIETLLASLTMCLFSTMTVYATDFDPTTLGKHDTGIFDDLKKVVTNIGGSAYNLAIQVGIILAVFAIIGLGFSIFLFSSGAKNDEHKSRAFYIVVAMTCILGATSAVALAKGIFGF